MSLSTSSCYNLDTNCFVEVGEWTRANYFNYVGIFDVTVRIVSYYGRENSSQRYHQDPIDWGDVGLNEIAFGAGWNGNRWNDPYKSYAEGIFICMIPINSDNGRINGMRGSKHIIYHRWLSDKPHEINGIIACINGGFRDGYGWTTEGTRGTAGSGLYLMMSVDEDSLDHWATCGSQTKLILFLSSEI